DRQRRVLEGSRTLAARLSQADCADNGVRVLTGGSDVHLVLVDLVNSTLDGKQAEDRLHSVGITVNRNAVPNDPRPPMVTSGLRIGTPALATRGFGAEAFAEIAEIIATALQPEIDASTEKDLRSRVEKLAKQYPLYPEVSCAPTGFTAPPHPPVAGHARMTPLTVVSAHWIRGADGTVQVRMSRALPRRVGGTRLPSMLPTPPHAGVSQYTGDDGMTVAPEGRRMLRLEVRNSETPIERKPSWIRTQVRTGPQFQEL